jgi:hypothetical protein
LFLCLVCSASTWAQDISQESQTTIFHIVQAGSRPEQGEAPKDSVLSGGGNPQYCCNVTATLNSIPSCGGFLEKGKGAEPLSDSVSCCCVDLQVSWFQKTACEYPICGCDVSFDDQSFNPICNVCYMPPGWGYTTDVPYDGILKFRYSGTNCSATPTSLDFKFCGQNVTDEYVCGNVTVYTCTTNPTSGLCQAGFSPCAAPFCATLTCSLADVASGNPNSLTVDAGYPNPATSSIRFGFSATSQGNMTMMLVDILGHTVSTTNNIVLQGDGSLMIDLAHLQPGGYFCVLDFNGTRITRRVQVK